MNDSDFLAGRGRALEDAFFHHMEQKRIEAEKKHQAEENRIERLSEASGVADHKVLEMLDDSGVTADTLSAFSLLPMISVAWANENLDGNERTAILKAAEDGGIRVATPAYDILKSWLNERPADSLIALWKEYAGALCAQLTPDARALLRDELLGRARSVAEASGGILGFGNKVSKVEQDVLDDLATAFEI